MLPCSREAAISQIFPRFLIEFGEKKRRRKRRRSGRGKERKNTGERDGMGKSGEREGDEKKEGGEKLARRGFVRCPYSYTGFGLVI